MQGPGHDLQAYGLSYSLSVRGLCKEQRLVNPGMSHKQLIRCQDQKFNVLQKFLDKFRPSRQLLEIPLKMSTKFSNKNSYGFCLLFMFHLSPDLLEMTYATTHMIKH